MKEQDKTKAQLIAELEEMRERVSELEQAGNERKQLPSLLTTQSEVLQMIACGAGLPEVLERLCLLMEQQSLDALCSILLLDETDGKLRSGAAPSLPQDYAHALDGLMVGEGQGSCGTAVARGKQVIVHDIAEDPLWTDFRDLALKHGIRACWSTPFFSQKGKVLGTFAISHKVPCSPTLYHQQLIQTATHLAGIAIERKQAEKELLESEERFRVLYEENPSMYFIVDVDGTVLSVNTYGARQLGYSVEELVGQPVLNVFYPDDKTAVTEQLKSCFDKPEQVSHWEFRKVRKDGKVLWVREAVRVIKDFGGKQVVFVVCEDITVHKQTEEALLDAEIRSRTLLEGSPVCNKIIDLDSRLQYMSAAGIKRLKIPDIESFYGCAYPPDFFPESTRTLLIEHLERAKIGEISSVECPALDMEGGGVWYHTTFTPARDDDDRIKYIIVSSVDITERKHAEEEKNKLEEQLRRSQKLETIGTLAGGIAHDFNNILTPIMGYTEMAMLDLPSNGPLREDLEQILKGAIRAKDLVEQILLFSRKIEKERQPLSLHVIVKEALKLLRPSIPAMVEIRHRIDTACEKILADASQMHQVIVNLCTNAWQAMAAKGGVLTIELKQVEVDAATAKLHLNLHEAEYVRLSVIDTGSGMDDKTLDRIFEPFFSTKAVDKGTGMGLAVVHGIVRSHHGDILVYSEQGKGTTFQVYLPTAQAGGRAAEKKPGALARGRESILVADDDDTVAKVVQRMLKHLGYDVDVRNSGLEALKAVRQQPDKYDLVISDLTMPNLTGLELSEQLRKVRSELSIIIMTGYGDILTKTTQETYGIKNVIGKPVVMHELASAIRVVLDK